MKLPKEALEMFREWGRKGGKVKNKKKGFGSRPEFSYRYKKVDNISKPLIIEEKEGE